MLYVFLASLFWTTVLLTILLMIGFIFNPPSWQRQQSKIKWIFWIWYIPYGGFIVFFTGPNNLKEYPPQNQAKYHLPWSSGTSRFVAQGNRSFTSHRDFHHYAWDFAMPNGTEILSSRPGVVKEVEDSYDGIGYYSNFITIEHSDGEKSVYAHIQKNGALVKVGDSVACGQTIALSGMVGQTVFPHVHFYVLNQNSTASIPISFKEVEGGVPFAGRFYTSENLGIQNQK